LLYRKSYDDFYEDWEGWNSDYIEEQIDDRVEYIYKPNLEKKLGREITEEEEKELKKKVEENLKEDIIGTYEDIMDVFEDFNDIFIVYRMITIKDFNDLNCEEIGKYWSWDKNRVEAHWRKDFGKETKSILITGLVSKKDVNWRDTILLNTHPYLGEEEAEIRMNENKIPIIITEIELIPKITGKKYIPIFKEQLPMKCYVGK